MNEENKKQNPELDDAALEGVSGGGSGLPSDPNDRATEICLDCSRPKLHKCSRSPSDLAYYMRKHGLIDDEHACPFYR